MQRKRGFSCGPAAGVAAAALVIAFIVSLLFDINGMVSTGDDENG